MLLNGEREIDRTQIRRYSRSRMKPRNQAGFNLVEVVLLVGVGIVLMVIFFPICTMTTGSQRKGQMTQTLSNMKQLHLATQQMVLDGVTAGNTSLGWPATKADPSPIGRPRWS